MTTYRFRNPKNKKKFHQCKIIKMDLRMKLLEPDFLFSLNQPVAIRTNPNNTTINTFSVFLENCLKHITLESQHFKLW